MASDHITLKDLPFDIVSDPEGTGYYAEFYPNGAIKEIYCIFKGIRGGPSVFFLDEPRAATHDSDNDLSWVYREGTAEQFSKFDDRSKPYPYDWGEFVADALASLTRFQLWRIKQGVLDRAAHYTQCEPPGLHFIERLSRRVNILFGLDSGPHWQAPKMPEELRRKYEIVSSG